MTGIDIFFKLYLSHKFNEDLRREIIFFKVKEKVQIKISL